MNWTMGLPLLIGCVGILQGAMNRLISNYIGVTQASVLTNIGSVILCMIFYFIVRSNAEMFPSLYHIKAPFSTYKWWFIFPPLFGFIIIAGIPYAIANLGAVKVTVGLIAAQMITSVLWDLGVEGIALNAMKLIGILFAFLSVTFVMLGK